MNSRYLRALTAERTARLSHAALLLSTPGEHCSTWTEDAIPTTVSEYVLSNLHVYDEEQYWRILLAGFRHLFATYSLTPSDLDLKGELDRFGYSVAALQSYFTNSLSLAEYALARTSVCQDSGNLYAFLREAAWIHADERDVAQITRYCSVYLDRVQNDAATIYRTALSVTMDKLNVSIPFDQGEPGAIPVFLLDNLNSTAPYLPINSDRAFWTTTGSLFLDQSDDGSPLDPSMSVSLLFGNVVSAAQAFWDLFEVMDEINSGMNYRQTIRHFWVSAIEMPAEIQAAQHLNCFIHDALHDLADFEHSTASDLEDSDMMAYMKHMSDLQYLSRQ